MLRPMSAMGQPVPPSPMRLQSPAICQRPAATAPRPGPSTVQETRLPTLPEHEGFVRAAYVTLAANDDTLQELAGQCEAEAIELPCPQRLLVRVLAASQAAHAQALAAIACYLRNYRPGLAARLRMVPIAQAGAPQAELQQEQGHEHQGKGAVQCKEGAAAAPARLYPVFLFCVPLAALDLEEAEARLDKAVQRLETALRISGIDGGDAGAFLPESATMVVSPWGNLDAPEPPPIMAVSGAGGADGRFYPSPTHHHHHQQQQQQEAALPADGIVRRVIPGRGTTHLLPTPPPAPLLDSLLLLRNFFSLDLAQAESLAEGHDFFQAWALATLGSHDQAGVVRERVAATIAARGDLLEEAAESVRRALGGGTAKDHLLRVANDMSLTGGKLEVHAAAIFGNVRIAVFDVDAQRLSTLAPPADGPLPVTREVALLHYQGAYWLLEPTAAAGEMDMTLTATMAVGGGSVDLDASMASASQRMSEL